MIRTVAVTPYIYAQGELIRDLGKFSAVRDGAREYVGRIVLTRQEEAAAEAVRMAAE